MSDSNGCGNCPMGVGPYGLGTPIPATVWGGSLFRDTLTGATLTGRRINTRTRDYEVDANGRIVGMTTAQQIVTIALLTEHGSSAVADLGQKLSSIEDIGDDFALRVDGVVRAALADAVARGIVRIDSVTAVQRGTNGAVIRVKWTDLTTQQEQETEV